MQSLIISLIDYGDVNYSDLKADLLNKLNRRDRN